MPALEPTARAPRVTTIFNAIASPLLAAGVPMGYNGLLTVLGRRSGMPRTTPLAFIEDDGRRFVWSPWGDVHWVRNLRAAGRATIEVRRRREDVEAIELDHAQRVAFFRDTFAPLVHGIPLGRQFIRMLDGVDIDDPASVATDHPVFELRTI